MAFKEIETIYPDLWDWDENDTLEGIYRGVEDKNTKFGVSKMYYVTPSGEADQVGFWGGAILDNKMAQVKAPSRVRIVYDGKEATEKGNQVKMFTVQVDEDWNGSEPDEDIPF
jgi:hypothetical protein